MPTGYKEGAIAQARWVSSSKEKFLFHVVSKWDLNAV